jgi:hypothetical protein
MRIGSGLLFNKLHQQGHTINHVYKDMWQTKSIDHVNKDVWEIYVSRPCQQGPVAEHTNKDMWQTMSTRTHGRPRQHIHMEELDDDKCQEKIGSCHVNK